MTNKRQFRSLRSIKAEQANIYNLTKSGEIKQSMADTLTKQLKNLLAIDQALWERKMIGLEVNFEKEIEDYQQ